MAFRNSQESETPCDYGQLSNHERRHVNDLNHPSIHGLVQKVGIAIVILITGFIGFRTICS